MPKTIAEGGCGCGAVRYALGGPPSNSMICHCRSCRRVSSAPVLAWLTVARADFRFIRGLPLEFRSSKPVCRSFCGACGTPLAYRHDDEPGFIDVTIGSLDDPDAFPPTHHSWLSHDLAWVRFGDGLPTFAKSRYARSG